MTKSKKPMSKKKKILIIVLSIIAFLFFATICAGVGVLNWYCTTAEYEIATLPSAQSDSVNLIAHRGLRSVAPENTAPAFEEAGEADFDGAECDIYRTSDGVWVVQHDSITYRMMNTTKFIEKSTYSELLEYYTDNGTDIESYDDLKICTLDEYLEICETYEMTAVIELKGKNNTEHYDEVLDAVNSYEVDVVFISFHENCLTQMRALDEDVKMYFLTQTITTDDIDFALEIGNCGIDFNANKSKNWDNDAEMIVACQTAGLDLCAWTVNDLETLENLVEVGVENITTDCIKY